VAPTTPRGVKTSTTPYRNIEAPFDVANLSRRLVHPTSRDGHVPRVLLVKAMKDAMQTKGLGLSR